MVTAQHDYLITGIDLESTINPSLRSADLPVKTHKMVPDPLGCQASVVSLILVPRTSKEDHMKIYFGSRDSLTFIHMLFPTQHFNGVSSEKTSFSLQNHCQSGRGLVFVFTGAWWGDY